MADDRSKVGLLACRATIAQRRHSGGAQGKGRVRLLAAGLILHTGRARSPEPPVSCRASGTLARTFLFVSVSR
jgi:hypothetical protein